jgi:hypothetical protein
MEQGLSAAGAICPHCGVGCKQGHFRVSPSTFNNSLMDKKNLRLLSPEEQELLEQYCLAKAAYDNSSDEQIFESSLYYAFNEAEREWRIALDDLEKAKLKVFTTKIYKDAIQNAYNTTSDIMLPIVENFKLARKNCWASFDPEDYLDNESQE